jgi:hypothetical protein
MNGSQPRFVTQVKKSPVKRCDSNHAFFSGRQSGEYFGAAVAAVDLNGDGIDEVPILSVVFFFAIIKSDCPVQICTG